MPMQAQRVGGGIVPTHTQHRRYIGLDGQHQVPVATSPGKPPGPIVQEDGWAEGRVKSRLRRDSIPGPPSP